MKKSNYRYTTEDFNFDKSIEEYYKYEKKIMSTSKSLFATATGWILWSSVNSNRISLTLRAGIPFLVLLGISDSETLENLVGVVGSIIAGVATFVTGVIALLGLIRKIWYSFPE